MELNDHKLDLVKEVEGVWHTVDDTTKFLIARMYNPKFNKMFQALSAPHQATAKRGILGGDIGENITAQCIAKTVLLGWEGLLQDGVDYPYTQDNAIALLKDPKLAGIRQWIIEQADNEATFRDTEIASAGKKSKTTSDGTGNGEKA